MSDTYDPLNLTHSQIRWASKCEGKTFHLATYRGTLFPWLVCDTCGEVHPIERVTRTCAQCREPLWHAARRDYCDDACKQAAYRERQARQ